MRILRRVAAFTAVCEEDGRWVDQYLGEAERLGILFGVHFDRCSQDLKERFLEHPLCVVARSQDDPTIEYDEKHKQDVFDAMAERADYRGWMWLLHWDIDEIWEKNAAAKLESLADRGEEYLYVRWVNCWGDLDHIRIDTMFEKAPRVKLYNVSEGRRWVFDHPITYGCKFADAEGNILAHERSRPGNTDIVCLHTGLMTRELRESHKARWDRIYTAAVGNNPYGFWDYCLKEEEYPPVVVSNTYR